MAAFTAFLLNIPVRYAFEKRVYEARDERPLRVDELKTFMSEAWDDWYGETMADPDPWFWASKLHFYISGVAFYNFPYLFGYLFSTGVYQRRGRFGADFHRRYVDLLRDTGRMTAEDIAEKHLEMDLTSVDCWRGVIKGLTPRVEAFEAAVAASE
jgi:oligoendopeptidase F